MIPATWYIYMKIVSTAVDDELVVWDYKVYPGKQAQHGSPHRKSHRVPR